MKSPVRIAIACALAATATAGLAAGTAIASAGGTSTVLVRMSSTEPMAALARETDPTFYFVQPEDHYDGAYFYAIARDPFATGDEHKLIDQAPYRYSHGGYGVLVWLLSFGRLSMIPNVLLILNLVGMGAAGALMSAIAVRYGRSGWWGLVIALSPGLIYAVTADTAEPVAIAFAAAGVLAWGHKRRGTAAAMLSIAVLCKEPMLVVPAGLLVWELLSWRRARIASPPWPAIASVVAPAAVFVGWQAYLWSRFHHVAVFAGKQNLMFWPPFKGWFDAIRFANSYTLQGFDRMSYATVSLTLIVVFAGVLIVGSVRSLWMRSPFAPMFLLLFVLDVFVTWYLLFYPKDLLRWSSIPLAVLPGVFLDARAERTGPSESGGSASQ
ncbi:MAG TPA: hypothetical protein VKV69_05355 [Actinomycetota bacterium]|nr:hypothetical protein [Actinomycetota bacterium]